MRLFHAHRLPMRGSREAHQLFDEIITCGAPSVFLHLWMLSGDSWMEVVQRFSTMDLLVNRF